MALLSRIRRRLDNPDENIAGGSGAIGLAGAFSIGIGGIVGGGIFATLGLATVESRGATFLSFLIGGLVALLTAYSYVKLSIAYPSKGGTVTFLNKAFGPGFFAGTLNVLLVLSYVVLLSVYAFAFANYAAATFFPTHDYALWHRVLVSAVIVLLALVNFTGPALVERSEGFFNLSKLLILFVFVALGLIAGGLTFERMAPSEWVSAPSIIAAGMLVFLSYEGFELIANVSDQVRDRDRNLPLAYYGSVTTALVFYVLIIFVVLGHMSFESITASRDYTLSAAAELFMGKSGFVLLAVGAILATASAINAGLFGASKLPQMLARVEEAPPVYLRQIGGRQPVGLIVISVLVLLIVNFLDLHSLSAAASAGFIIIFFMVNLANAKLAQETGSNRRVSVTAAAVCLVALAIMLAETALNPSHRKDLWFIAGLVVLPVFYQTVHRCVRYIRGKKEQA
ncbi:MAG TPA: APC family permease [Thermodesulfobacteriota bacterium]|nr:APC family permease [Thermodesulfobacteriota bacterium]